MRQVIALMLGILGVLLIGQAGVITYTRHGEARPFWRLGLEASPNGVQLVRWRIPEYQRREITPVLRELSSVVWAHDARELYFVDYSLHRMDISGRDVERLTASFDGAPALSPDGEWIAFQSLRENSWDIYRLRLSDGYTERITDSPGDDSTPVWSPDGAWLAYLSYRGGNWDLYGYELATGKEQVFSSYPEHEFSPYWARDGLYFYLNSYDSRRFTHRLRLVNGIPLVDYLTAGMDNQPTPPDVLLAPPVNLNWGGGLPLAAGIACLLTATTLLYLRLPRR